MHAPASRSSYALKKSGVHALCFRGLWVGQRRKAREASVTTKMSRGSMRSFWTPDGAMKTFSLWSGAGG